MKIIINNTKFLDRENEVFHKDVLTLASEGEWKESTKFKKEDGTPATQFEINLKLSNEDLRSTVISYGNVKLLVQAFGDETKNWVGKKVRAWKTKSEKAKSGFTFFFVPTDWERDDTGEWVIPTVPTTYPDKFTSEKEQQTSEEIEYPQDELGEIPFN